MPDSQDKGYHWGKLFPHDPSNYGHFSQHQGMQDRKAADDALWSRMIGGESDSSSHTPISFAGVDPEDLKRVFLLVLAALVAIAIGVGLYRAARQASDAIKFRLDRAADAERAELEAAAAVMLRKQITAIGDRRTTDLVQRYMDQSPCHRTQTALRFSGGRSFIFCPGATEDGHLGESYFFAKGKEQVATAAGVAQLQIEARVFPFNAGNLAALGRGLSALDASNKAIFAAGVERMPQAKRQALLRRPECAVVQTRLNIGVPIGKGRAAGTAAVAERMPPRIGCQTATGFALVF